MSKKNKQRRKKKLKKLEEQSDWRTAEFVVRRLDDIETDLGDLIPDLQAFSHYAEIGWLSCCLGILRRVRKKYRKIADGQPWDEDE